MSTNKPQNIDEYIAGFPEDVRDKLEQIRSTIKKAAPAAEEAIKYDMPTFTLNGSNLIHFGAYKKHIGLYPAPKEVEEFKEALAEFKGSKGTVQLPLDKPMPLSLIAKIVKYSVKRSLEKAGSKK